MNAPDHEWPEPASNGGLAAWNLHLVRRGRCVLQDITLQAQPGRVLALIGPNGAGKSTLLSVLAGLAAPSLGSVTLDRRSLASWPAHELAQRRAVLSQHVQLDFAFRAEEVVMLGRRVHGQRRHEHHDEAMVESAMHRARASHLKGRNYLQLSAGEQRRVQLARVLAQIGDRSSAPAWLLLDEPEASLDIAHQHDILEQVHAISRQGHGVIVVLHDLNLAARYADHVALMNDGLLLSAGEVERVLEPRLLSNAYGVPMKRVRIDGGHWIMAVPR